jgi:ubiquinone/menaquinone biosynthesis C-methylase UbiE
VKRALFIGVINRYPPPAGWEHVHVDLSERPLHDLATNTFVPPDVVADMRDLPFPDASFDRVRSWHSLEHVNQEGGWRAVCEFHRVLKPGGVLDVQVPNIGALAGVHSEQRIEELLTYIYGQQPSPDAIDADYQVHRWGYTYASMTRLLIDAGFSRLMAGSEGDLHILATR